MDKLFNVWCGYVYVFICLVVGYVPWEVGFTEIWRLGAVEECVRNLGFLGVC